LRRDLPRRFARNSRILGREFDRKSRCFEKAFAARVAFGRCLACYGALPLAFSIATLLVLMAFIAGVFGFLAIFFASEAWAQSPLGPTANESGPPIIKLPAEVVDPPRTLPAEQWNSAYCRRWEDGCMECGRTAFGATPQCHATTKSRSADCHRRLVICYEAIDDDYFSRICPVFYEEEYFAGKDGAIFADGAPRDHRWHFENNRWTVESLLVRREEWALRTPLRRLTNQGWQNVFGDQVNSHMPLHPAFGQNVKGLRCLATY
jgi:hypothetical protein